MQSLRTAKEWGIIPTVFLGLNSEERGWSRLDRILTTALHLYEASLCPDCKTPAYLAFDEETDGWFEVNDSHVCFSCAARERYAKEAKNPEPGLKLFTELDPDFYK